MPGGFVGACCVVPGGVRGSGAVVRVEGGAVCCCSVPGGRVASRCAGVCCCVEVVCGAAYVETTKGSPTFLKTVLRGCSAGAGVADAVSDAAVSELFSAAVSLLFAVVLGEVRRDLAREAAVSFPKADTAFPKTRNAERQTAESAFAL